LNAVQQYDTETAQFRKRLDARMRWDRAPVAV
jgi:hypothetical protein